MINLNVTFHSEEAYAGSRFKLLILKARETEAYSLIIDVFLDFLNDFHSGTRSLKDTGIPQPQNLQAT